MAYNKLIFPLIFITNILFECNADCQMTLQDADACGHKAMFFGNRETVVPTNGQELDQHCQTLRDSLKCLTEFADSCVEGTIQSLFKIGLKKGSNHVDLRCNNPKDREEFLSHAKCLVQKEKMEPFHICADKNLIMLEKLKEMAVNDRTAAGCCIYYSFKECVHHRNKEICGDDTKDYWDNVISEMADDAQVMRCEKYNSVEKCKTYEADNPTIWQQFHTLIDTDDPTILATRHKFGSGIALSVEIMKSFKL